LLAHTCLQLAVQPFWLLNYSIFDWLFSITLVALSPQTDRVSTVFRCGSPTPPGREVAEAGATAYDLCMHGAIFLGHDYLGQWILYVHSHTSRHTWPPSHIRSEGHDATMMLYSTHTPPPPNAVPVRLPVPRRFQEDPSPDFPRTVVSGVMPACHSELLIGPTYTNLVGGDLL
jgi:hypothetical protein